MGNVLSLNLQTFLRNLDTDLCGMGLIDSSLINVLILQDRVHQPSVLLKQLEVLLGTYKVSLGWFSPTLGFHNL